jgi:hypothetical protein
MGLMYKPNSIYGHQNLKLRSPQNSSQEQIAILKSISKLKIILFILTHPNWDL